MAVYTDAAYTQTMLVTDFSKRLQHILLKYHAVSCVGSLAILDSIYCLQLWELVVQTLMKTKMILNTKYNQVHLICGSSILRLNRSYLWLQVQMEWSRDDMLGFNVHVVLKKVSFFETNPVILFVCINPMYLSIFIAND